MAWLVLIKAVAASALALAAGAACGQGMSDPTRPPASAGPVQSGAATGGLVLQSVLIFPDARSAIISGEHVLLGQKIGGQRLVKVAETEVVLLHGAERRTLKLFPRADKRPAMATRSMENSKP